MLFTIFYTNNNLYLYPETICLHFTLKLAEVVVGVFESAKLSLGLKFFFIS